MEGNYGGIPHKKKVVSIRKDGALLVEGDNNRRDWIRVKETQGKIVPASDWNQLIIYNDEAEIIIAKIATFEAEKETIDRKIKELTKSFKPLDLSFIKPYIENNEPITD